MTQQKAYYYRLMTDFRKRFLLTQERMAEIFGLKNAQVISQWETGHHEPMLFIKKTILTLLALPKQDAEKFLALMEKNK